MVTESVFSQEKRSSSSEATVECLSGSTVTCQIRKYSDVCADVHSGESILAAFGYRSGGSLGPQSGRSEKSLICPPERHYDNLYQITNPRSTVNA